MDFTKDTIAWCEFMRGPCPLGNRTVSAVVERLDSAELEYLNSMLTCELAGEIAERFPAATAVVAYKAALNCEISAETLKKLIMSAPPEITSAIIAHHIAITTADPVIRDVLRVM